METRNTAAPLPIDIDVEDVRRMARDAAEAAIDTVMRRQMETLRDGDEAFGSGYLSFATGHTGDAPIPLDAAAREAVQGVINEQLPRIAPGRRHHDAGEEAGGATTILRRGDIIDRTDDLDGSTNADCLLNNFSGVVGIDLVQEPSGADRRAKHLAGAIALPSGLTVSWINLSRWLPQVGRYSRVRGSVYFSNTIRGIDEFQLSDPRWDRREHTYAAVASKRKRLDALLTSIGVANTDDVIYNIAGTPVVAALLAGALSKNIEVEAVTLHDSMHLIPHQLLGGRVHDLDSVSPLDYLALYERETVNLDPKAKPVPPYIATGGLGDNSAS